MKPTSKPPLYNANKPIKDVLDTIIAKNPKDSNPKVFNNNNKPNDHHNQPKTYSAKPDQPLRKPQPEVLRGLRAKRTGSSKELDTKPPVGLLAFHSETLNNRKPQMNVRYNLSPVRGSNLKDGLFKDSGNKSVNRGSNSGAIAARKNKVFLDNAQSSLMNKPYTYKVSPKGAQGTQIKLEKDQSTHKYKLGGNSLKYAGGAGDLYDRKNTEEKVPSLSGNKISLSNPINKGIKTRYNKEGVEAKPVLILFDHDLGFIKDYLVCFDLPLNFICEKLYSFDYENHISPSAEIEGKKGKLSGYAGIFIFLKFSPRVKSSSLKMLQKMVKNEDCFVIKCLLAVESVDLNLDYENESMTIEKKKKIEHNLFLEKQTFDAYNIGYQEVSQLEEFFKSKLNLE